MSYEIPQWYSISPPIYDIHKSYHENAANGPFFSGKPFQRKDEQSTRFLGFNLKSPIGIAAGPLLNANWIQLGAKLGFDILTYKTIRSFEHPGHPLPNMVYVDLKEDHAKQRNTPPGNISDLTLTNSFGMPSQSPEFLLSDILRAKNMLNNDQVLIVSIVGSEKKEKTLLQDFVETAQLAKQAKAQVIEANFSCPNVTTGQGQLYLDPKSVYIVSKAICNAIAPIPLIIKVGIFPSFELLKMVMIQAARAGVRAICGLNSIGRPIFNQHHSAALGIQRPTSGVCGGQIRKFAIEFIRKAHQINQKEVLDLTLMGVGGIMQADHFDAFFQNGADIALCATSVMFDPYIALRYHNRRKSHAVH